MFKWSKAKKSGSLSNRRNDPDEKRSDHIPCRAFQSLSKWQLQQYRAAIDENKWYMGERFGREVAWDEAERDFLVNGYYGCAEVWRVEYCSDICPHGQGCSLGRRFNQESFGNSH